MTQDFPPVTFIIPVLNGVQRIEELLESIRSQEYPADVEVVVGDGGSTDGTQALAERLGCRVVPNELVTAEGGKTAGLAAATHEIVCLLDDDNRLPHADWLRQMVAPLVANPDLVGSSAIWFTYDQDSSALDRYCSLFGVNDPLAFYMGRRDRLMRTESAWGLDGTAQDMGEYFLVQFPRETLITLGSQGFVARKALLQATNWTPYFFHIDSCHELIRSGHDRFALVKTEIIHQHSATLRTFFRKLNRNITLFFEYRSLRGPSWATAGKGKLAVAVFQMLTVIRPGFDSVNGYRKIRDRAWFLHVFLAPAVAVLYSVKTIEFAVRQRLGR